MAWYGRLWNAVRPGRISSELERELSFHVAERVDELRAAGMSEDEARRRARAQFGNYTAQVERTRDMDINGGVDAILRNLRLAGRTLSKSPGFAATVVLTLALGIGANSAVFSAVYTVLLRPLPLPDADRLVTVSQVNPKSMQPFLAPVRLEDWNRLSETFEAITGSYQQDDSETSGELPEKLTHAFVAPRFLQVWGVAPQLGRDFAPAELKFNGPNAVLISDRLWRRRFGGDPNVVGKALRIGRSSYPIVGVMPASFRFPDRGVDLWSPNPADAPFAQNRELTWYTAVGRMKAGVTVEQARANLATVQASLAARYPKTDKEIRSALEPLKEAKVGGVRRSLLLLFGSVSLLLLIACTNIAALLLSRAAGRQHEISVRYSLGASRASVMGQLLTEVLVLALAGSVLGLALAAGGSAVFRFLAKDLPRLEEIRLDWRIVLYSLVCAVAATLVCGVIPAIRGTRRDLAQSIATAGRSQVSARSPIQFVLVGVQVALAVTLLAGAGLLLRSFQALARVSPGFDAERVLTFHMSSSWSESMDPKAAQQRANRITDALRVMPGVEMAASALGLPGVPGTFQIEMQYPGGRAETEPKMMAEGRLVSAGYFALMRIPLLAGAVCSDDPSRSTMMVNRSFANSYLNGAAGIGRRLMAAGNSFASTNEVTGIVGDARELGLEKAPVPTIYWCGGGWQPGSHFLVRTHGDPRAMAETVRRKMHEVAPARSVYDLTPLTDRISDGYAENRLRTVLLTFFALTAVSLACIGIYGTLSYVVGLRQREVALRLALGAMRSRILRHFLAQGASVAVAGCVVGLGLSVASARLLAGMLYGVKASDAVTLVGVAVVVLAVSAMASLLPAARAATLDPMRVLRDE